MQPVHLGSALPFVVGGGTAQRLAKAGIHTVGDLLRHYPRTFEERGKLTDISGLRIGEKATIMASVVSVTTRHLGPGRRGPKSITTMTVTDGHRKLICVFFNQPFWVKALPVGTSALFAGTVKAFQGRMQLTSPQVARIKDEPGGDAQKEIELIESFPGGQIPVYPLPEGTSQPLMQRAVKSALDVLEPVPETLPGSILRRRNLIGLDEALRAIHRPISKEQRQAAESRLRYDEALAVQLVLAHHRRQAAEYPARANPIKTDGLLAAFDARLPFELTEGQRLIAADLKEELECFLPMNRLLQGEVGSGKTVLAMRAMLQVVDAGRQAVLLAPTEVLAAQHTRSVRNMLGPLARRGEVDGDATGTKVTLLTGSLAAAARKQALADISSGQAGIVVGTHALLGDDVTFADLALVVVDEQHRFGVEQREALRRKGSEDTTPHLLVMTATPIPRTVALTAYGDMDTSKLAELPGGRAPITTNVVGLAKNPQWLARVWQRVCEEVAKGHQVYIVCPRIGEDPDDSDDPAQPTGRKATASRRTSAVDAENMADDGDDQRPPMVSLLKLAKELTAGPLRELRVGVLHGRLPSADKDRIMRDFAAGAIHVLISTTVIEVGVDVPNASMMVICDADRFGISQLHQLRGRVGRGAAPGLCLLVSTAFEPSSSMDRLRTVERTLDGFELAEADLAARQEGDVVGTSQAGKGTFLLRLSEHRNIIENARQDALELMSKEPVFRRDSLLLTMAGALIGETGRANLDKR